MSTSSNEEIIKIEVVDDEDEAAEEEERNGEICLRKKNAKCGRKLALEWNNVFTSRGVYKCKHCYLKVSPKVERIRNHLQKCAKYKRFVNTTGRKRRASYSDANTNEEWSDVESERNPQKYETIGTGAKENVSKMQDRAQHDCIRSAVPSRSSTSKSTSFSSTTATSITKRSTGKQHLKKIRGGNKSMYEYVIPTTRPTTTAQKRKIDEVVAEYIYACNIPFEKVEHPSFLQLIEMLRPGYKPPSRKELAGELLDTVSSKIDNLMAIELKKQNRPLTLLQDGS